MATLTGQQYNRLEIHFSLDIKIFLFLLVQFHKWYQNKLIKGITALFSTRPHKKYVQWKLKSASLKQCVFLEKQAADYVVYNFRVFNTLWLSYLWKAWFKFSIIEYLFSFNLKLSFLKHYHKLRTISLLFDCSKMETFWLVIIHLYYICYAYDKV